MGDDHAAALECALLAAEERCRALEASREHLWRTLRATVEMHHGDVAEGLVDHVARAPSSEAVRAEEASLKELMDALQARRRRAVSANIPSPTRPAECADSSATRGAVALGERACPRQHIHAQLETCEGSFEHVVTIIGDCIAQLDRPSPFASMVRTGA
ncbi:hypothetical protein KFE25_003369 [Diacronema lutheri]|uniref:Uncharacterized protein n=1 Tax=Diacronema lutheri TaxID=2081491 RepID=A0A8J5X9K6_DIALT|nr:hypothetical protein KFE25_003369 [Diacronema lutheri]